MVWQPTHLTAIQREERRLEAARLLRDQELSQAEIARRLGTSRMAVTKWKQQLLKQRGEIKGLAMRPRSGRPAKLTPRQWQVILRQLQRGASASGFPSERWTLRRIQQIIARRYGVGYHERYLGQKLRRLGWSCQHPAVVAKERDDQLVAAWLRQDWPRIKKSVSKRCGDPLR